MSSDIYHDFRNKFNEKIIKNLQQSKNNLYISKSNGIK